MANDILSIEDLRASAPQSMQGVSDEDLISGFASQAGISPEEVAAGINYVPQGAAPITDLQSLRATAPAEMADYSDERLIVDFADMNGLDARDFAETIGYDTGSRNFFVSGLKAGVDQGQGLMINAYAGAKDAVVAGDNSAEDELAYAKEQEYQGRLHGRSDLDRVEDQTWGSAAEFAGYQLAKLAPVSAGIVGAGLAVGAAGAPIAAGSLVAGSAVGLGALYEASAADGDANPYLSALGAPIYGALEAVVPYGATRLLKGVAPQVMKNLGGLGTTALGGVTESGTEYVQNEMEMEMDGTLSDDQKSSARLNSAVVGVIGGVGITGSAQVMQGTFARNIDPNGEQVNLTDTGVPAPVDENAPTLQEDEVDFGKPDEEVMVRLQEEMDEANKGAVRNEVKAVQDLSKLHKQLREADALIKHEKENRKKGRPSKASLRAREIAEENRVGLVGQIESLTAGIEASRRASTAMFKMADYNRGVRKIRELKEGNGRIRVVGELTPEEFAALVEMHPKMEEQLLAALEAKEDKKVSEIDLAAPVVEEAPVVEAPVVEAPVVEETIAVEGTGVFEGIDEYTDDVFLPEGSIEANEQAAVEKVQETVNEEPVDTIESLQAILDEEQDIVNGGDAIAMSVGVSKLSSLIDSTQGETAPGVRPDLDQGVISGIVRMLINPKLNPKPIVYEGKTAKPNVEATANNTEMMRTLYDALNEVIKQQGIVSNRNKQINKGKQNIADYGHEPGINAEEEASAASKKLSVAMDAAVEAAGGNVSNVEAIIAAVKKRTNRTVKQNSVNVPLFAEMSEFLSKTGKKKKGKFKGFSHQDELNTTIDTLLSSAFTKLQNNELDAVTPPLDIVRGKPKRRSYERKTKVVTAKGEAPVTVDNETILEHVLSENGGIIEVLEAIIPGDGTGVASGYAITLAGRVKDVIKNLNSQGVYTKIEFTRGEKGEKSFDQTERVVRIPNEATEEQVLHETLHAALAWFIDQNPTHPAVAGLVESLEAVFGFVEAGGLADINMSEEYKASATEVVRVLKDLYGDGVSSLQPWDSISGKAEESQRRVLAAVNELISYGSTMREFKDMLKFIKQDPSEATKTWKDQLEIVWQRFSDLMSFAIQVKDTVANSVIDNSLHLLQAAAIKDSKETPNLYDTSFVRGHKLHMQKKNWKGEDVTDSAPVDNNGRLMSDELLKSGRARSLLSLLPTKKVMANLGLSQERYDKYVLGSLDKAGGVIADLVRDKFPGIGGKISYWHAPFMLKKSMRGLTDINKVEARAGYQIVGDIMTMLEHSDPAKTQQFKDYLDGDSTAIDSWKNPVEFKIAVEIMLENWQLYLSRLTADERAFLDFKTGGSSISDSLLYVSTVGKGGSSPIAMGDLKDAIRAQTVNVDRDKIDDSSDLFDDLGDRDVVYQVIVTPVQGRPYKLMVGKHKYETLSAAGMSLPITDGTYNVQEDTTYKLARVQNSKKEYHYRKHETSSTPMEKKAALEWTAAMRNTFNLMATKFAAHNYQRNILLAGKISGDVYNNADELYVGTGLQLGEDIVAVELESVTQDRPNKAVIRQLRQGGWVKFPDEPGKYGDLAGKLVSGPVVTSMTDLMYNGLASEAPRWMTFMRRFKKSKTTLNPGTHITNTLSNVVFAELHGITIAQVQLASKMFIMYKYKAHKLSPHLREIMKAFLSSGAMLGSYSHTEVTKQHDQLVMQKVLPDQDVSVFGKLASWGQLESNRQNLIAKLVRGGMIVDQATLEVYSLEDNIFRLAAFMKKSGQLMDEQGLTDVTPEILRESGDWARYAFVDYSNDSVALKNIRNTALPFATWMYVMAPTLAKTIVTQPHHTANLLIAIQAVSMLFSAIAGDDEEHREKNPELQDTMFGVPFLPYTQIRIPGFGDSDTAYYFDMGGYFPFTTAGKTSPTAFAAMDEYPAMLRPSGPLISGLLLMLTGQDPYTGKPISDELQSKSDDYWDLAWAGWDVMAPPFLRAKNTRSKRLDSVAGVIRGDMDWQYNERDIWYKLIKGVAGLRIGRNSLYESDASNSYEENMLVKKWTMALKKLEKDFFKQAGHTRDHAAYNAERGAITGRYEIKLDEIRNPEPTMEAQEE